MAADLLGAINQAMSICWDESIGYRMGGMAYSSSDGVDCSGLVGRVLHDNGFNYPSYHVGTINMESYLTLAGFQITHIYDLNTLDNIIKPGDIVVMNHMDLTGGHTFFYMENIQAYTDYNAYSDNVGNVSRAKVEASSTRGHTADGDHRRDGTGAYWEVWCHAYYALVSGYDPQDPNDEIFLAHWPPGLIKDDIFILKRIRDGQYNIDSWTNKYNDIGI